jgi:hypothetical protein
VEEMLLWPKTMDATTIILERLEIPSSNINII